MSDLVGGIEGGATNSNCILLNSNGEVVGKASGSDTNHHLIGYEECQRRIANLVNEAKNSAGLSIDTPLKGLGLSLSGCETKETNDLLLNGLIKTYPNLSEKYWIASDTAGSLAAATSTGGVVCIAGTGSNTLIMNPDGSTFQAGGWGYILGDEGSAWNIAYTAIKICFDSLDDFKSAPYPIDTVWSNVQSFFKIQDQTQILDYFYGKFEKAYIASFTTQLRELALKKDPLAQYVFDEAASDLARYISAVAGHADPSLTAAEGGLRIVCVGSVWKSFDIMQGAFQKTLDARSPINEITLLRLKSPLGYGAALMASDKLKIPVARDYSKNYDIFYTYKKSGNSAINFKKGCCCKH